MIPSLVPHTRKPFLSFLEAWRHELVAAIVQDIYDGVPFYQSIPLPELIASIDAISNDALLAIQHPDCMDAFHQRLSALLTQRFAQGLSLPQALQLPMIVRRVVSQVLFLAITNRISGAEEGLLVLGNICDTITSAIAHTYHQYLEETIRHRTAELTLANEQLQQEIAERTRLHNTLQHQQAEIRRLNTHLERRVDERTRQLANEIVQHRRTERALLDSNQRYQLISELTSDFIYSMVVESDGQIRLEWCTEPFVRSLGYDTDELRTLGETWMQKLIHTDDMPIFFNHVQEVFAGNTNSCEFRLCAKDGEVRWIRSYARPEFDPRSGRLIRILGAQKDITMWKREEHALRASEARYRAVVEDQTELICRFLPDGTITFANQAYARFFDKQPDTLLGNMILLTLPDDEQDLFQNRIAILHPHNPVLEWEHQVLDGDGKRCWHRSTIRALFDQHDNLIEYQIVGHDITDQKRVEEQLRYNTMHDLLTRLPNRSLFFDRLDQAMKRFRNRPTCPFAVILLDLDNFKVISASLGHLLGDDILKMVATRLSQHLENSDTLARSGDDEFVILAESITSEDDACHIAEHMQQVLQAPFSINGHELVISASMGITLSSSTYQQPEEMLRDADTAMHHAKAHARAGAILFNPAMHRHAVARLHTEANLRRAIERQEFLLFYQPIVSLKSNRIVGFEALIRWKHPVRGCISPAEFIPIAEETGLILPLGQWVLQEACYQLNRWNRQFPHLAPLTVHVNLSPREFLQPNLKQHVAQCLANTRLHPPLLNLEITESVMMSNAETTMTTLYGLRDLGVHLSIDDFGVGYSSLCYLQQFPVSTVKIDRSFVSKITTNAGSTAIVEAIVMLSHALGMETIAEGVHSLEDLAQLESMGCDYAQGYLYSEPLSPDSMESFLADGARLPTLYYENGHDSEATDSHLQPEIGPTSALCHYPIIA